MRHRRNPRKESVSLDTNRYEETTVRAPVPSHSPSPTTGYRRFQYSTEPGRRDFVSVARLVTLNGDEHTRDISPGSANPDRESAMLILANRNNQNRF